MADKHFTHSADSGNLPDNISSLLDLLLTQEEYHRDELLRLKRLRQRVEALIPDSYNHLWQQVNEIVKDSFDEQRGGTREIELP